MTSPLSARGSQTKRIRRLVALLPWWAGVLVALVSYLVLHRLAIQPVAPTSGGLPTQAIWKGLATAGQNVVSIVCLIGAATSAWRRKKRGELVADVAQRQATSALVDMSWREFEMLVGKGFRLQGYQVMGTGGGGPDGGIDLVLSRPGKNGSENSLVKCKQWRANKVGLDVVRELYGVMAAKGAAGSFVVTSGRFTDEAVEFAHGRNVTLVDGSKLHALIRQARASGKRAPGPAPTRRPLDPARQASTDQIAAPECPACAEARHRQIRGRPDGAATQQSQVAGETALLAKFTSGWGGIAPA